MRFVPVQTEPASLVNFLQPKANLEHSSMKTESYTSFAQALLRLNEIGSNQQSYQTTE